MALLLINPDDGTFQPIDQGRTAEYNLLLNILIEQRVTNMLLAQGMGISDELNSLRADVISDPQTIKTA